jgi:ankyrin repeat protein
MKKMKCVVIPALLLGLLTACSTLPHGFEYTPDQVLVHQASGTSFPMQIAGFSRSTPVSYNPQGTDISVHYESTGSMRSSLDMYVFPAGNAEGPIGLARQHDDFVSSIIQEHAGVIVESDADVALSQAGEMHDAKQAAFAYTEEFSGFRQKLFSQLAEFEYRGWFISYRMDTPAAGREQAVGMLVDFIREAPLPAVARVQEALTFRGIARTGTPQDVQAAISAGADVNAKDKNGGTVLMAAAARNPDPAVITTILGAGGKLGALNDGGETALIYAAATNPNPAVTTELVAAGADLEAKSKTGLTALMFAAAYNSNPRVITALLDAGARLEDKANNAATALMFAAWGNRNPEVIITLLQAGAAIDARDDNGSTALMIAVLYNPYPGTIAALLAAGADARAKDKSGKTAWQYARESGRLNGTEAYTLLQKASP